MKTRLSRTRASDVISRPDSAEDLTSGFRVFDFLSDVRILVFSSRVKSEPGRDLRYNGKSSDSEDNS